LSEGSGGLQIAVIVLRPLQGVACAIVRADRRARQLERIASCGEGNADESSVAFRHTHARTIARRSTGDTRT